MFPPSSCLLLSPRAAASRTPTAFSQFILILLGCFLVSAQQSFAQDPQTGFPRFGTFAQGNIDSINLSNLNVHFQLPVFAKKGRGVDFTANLIHDNSVLHIIDTPPMWNYYFPDWYLETPGGGRFKATWSHQNCNGRTGSTVYTNFAYMDAQHTVHSFGDYLEIDPKGICFASSGTSESQDGWFLSITSANNNIVPVVTDPNGNVIRFTSNRIGDSLVDPNGNQILIGATSITDTTGSTVITTQSTGTPPTLISYQYANPSGGASEAVSVTYSAFTWETQFNCPSGPRDPTGGLSLSLPTSISLPDGISYAIVYESVSGTYPSTVTTGRIHSLTLPSGSVITYTYSGGTNGVTCKDGGPAVLTKQTPDGTWTYNRSQDTSTRLWTTTVTDPAGNDAVYTFGYDVNGMPTVELQRLIYQGSSSSGTLLQSRVTCYNGNFFSNDLTGCASAAPTLPIFRKDVYTTPAGGTTSLSEALYNGAELITQDNEYDFGVNISGAPSGTPIRSTLTSYANIGSNILTKPACVQVTQGTSPSTCGTVTSTTKSITNYLNYDSHGNVGQTQNWVSGSNYLSQSFTYYSTGLANTATDVNGAQTSYTYGACNSSYPTLINEPLGLSKSMTWDCNGGVVTSVTDENNQKTSYSYINDPFWRVTSVTDPLNNVTTLSYTPTTSESTLTFNGGSSTEDTLVTFDSFGRVKVQQQRQACDHVDPLRDDRWRDLPNRDVH
jgi:hypothetical protein